MALPQVIIDVGLTGPTMAGTGLIVGDATRGLIGTATVGSGEHWTDITADVRSWSFRRGATRGDGPNLRYEAGTATIELNDPDRRYDPTNLNGPYVAAGETQLQPMVRVRIRAVWDGVTYPLWYGYADRWLPDQGLTWSTVTLTATDAFKVFSSYDPLEGAAVGGGEDSGARINRILNSIAWPADDRVTDTGNSTLQATTLGANVLTELLLTADSELGEFHMDAQGRAVFRRRHALILNARSVASQATFGDAGLAAGEIPYARVLVDNDDSTMANLITIARAGGTEQTVEDVTSRSKYLTKTYGRSDLLLQTDAAALEYANALLAQTRIPELRFTALELATPRPHEADQVWPAVLGREFADRVTVIRRPYAPAARTNLARNPSFEGGTTGYLVGAGTLTTSTAVAYRGSISGLLTVSGAGSYVGTLDTVMEATPGAVYSMQAWLRMSTATSRTVTPRVYFLNSSGGVLVAINGSTRTISQSDWTQVTVVGQVAPAGTAYISAYVFSGGDVIAGDAWHIDALLVEKEAPNLATNPSFETDTNGYQAGGGTLTRSTALAYDGSASGLLTVSGGGSYVGTLDNLMEVTAGDTYTATARVRMSTATSRTAFLRAYFLSPSGAVLTAPNGSTQTVSAGAWTELTVSAAAPTGAAYISAYVFSGADVIAGDAWHLDHLVVTRQVTAVGTYFDGDSGGSHRWFGTAHNSTSGIPESVPNERDVFVRGIEMGSDGASWRTQFTLQSAARGSYLVLDDPVLGVIGSNALAY